MKRSSLPVGLPARFTHPETGFPALCRFLGIANRQQQQHFVAQEPVREYFRRRKASFKNLKTAERLRAQLTQFLSDPTNRLAVWILRRKEGLEIPFPSFEVEALKTYEKEADAPADEDLERSLADIPHTEGIRSRVKKWRKSALEAWPAIRADLGRYAELDDERREAALTAAFAAATVLDCRGFLEWASESVEDLKTEFAFALGPEEAKEEAKDEPKEAVKEEESKNEEDQEEPPAGEAKWESAYGEFYDFVAAEGRGGLPPDRLDEVSRRIETLRRLRDDLSRERTVALRSGELFEKLRTILGRATPESGAEWFTALLPKVREQWKNRYPPAEPGGFEAFEEDLRRLEEALPKALASWTVADAEARDAEAEKERLESEEPPESEQDAIEGRIVELQERIATASRRRMDARRQVREIVAPRAEAPDPSPGPRPTERKARDRKAPTPETTDQGAGERAKPAAGTPADSPGTISAEPERTGASAPSPGPRTGGRWRTPRTG